MSLVHKVRSLTYLATTDVHHIWSLFKNTVSCNWLALVPAFIKNAGSIVEKLLFLGSQPASCYAYNILNINSPYLATGWRPLAEGHFPALVRLHGTVFLHFWETKRYAWTLLSVISNVFCLLHTDTAHKNIRDFFNDSALYKCSLNNNNNNNKNISILDSS